MLQSDTAETLVRILFYLPLIDIAWQVWQLRELLPSRAWLHLGIGFTLVAIMAALPFLPGATPILLYLAIRVAAYGFIDWGFRRFKQDMRRVHNLRFPVQQEEEEEIV